MTEPRALGLDIGERRVGVAASDSMGIAASPVEVIDVTTPDAVASRIAWLAKDRGVALLVVGMPFNMDGSEHKTAAVIRARAELCARKAGLPIEYVDERLTTVEAGRRLWEAGLTHKNRKERVDRVAAALILQSWLESRAAARRRAAAADATTEEE